MIPTNASDIEASISEADRQRAEVHELLGSLPARALTWRPGESKWSPIGHVAHLCIVNERYLAALRERIDDARARGGSRSDGPYRHPRIGSWFARSMEPPPKRRLKTLRSMVPDPTLDSGDVLQRFAVLQGELRSAMEDARGLDLGRVRFGSPFLALIRLSLGTGFALILAHNRRHVWLIREVMARDGFPGGEGAATG